MVWAVSYGLFGLGCELQALWSDLKAFEFFSGFSGIYELIGGIGVVGSFGDHAHLEEGTQFIFDWDRN